MLTGLRRTGGCAGSVLAGAGVISPARMSCSRNPARRSAAPRSSGYDPVSRQIRLRQAIRRFNEENQFDLHRREDLLRSRLAGAHAALLSSLAA